MPLREDSGPRRIAVQYPGRRIRRCLRSADTDRIKTRRVAPSFPRPNSLLRTCGWCGLRHCWAGEERCSSRQGPDQGFRDRAGIHGREGVSVPAVPGSRARPHAGTVLPHPPDPAGPARFVPAGGWEEGRIPPYGRRVGARPHGTNSCAARCAFWTHRAGGRPEPGRQMRAGCLTDRCPAGGAAV